MPSLLRKPEGRTGVSFQIDRGTIRYKDKITYTQKNTHVSCVQLFPQIRFANRHAKSARCLNVPAPQINPAQPLRLNLRTSASVSTPPPSDAYKQTTPPPPHCRTPQTSSMVETKHCRPCGRRQQKPHRPSVCNTGWGGSISRSDARLAQP